MVTVIRWIIVSPLIFLMLIGYTLCGHHHEHEQ